MNLPMWADGGGVPRRVNRPVLVVILEAMVMTRATVVATTTVDVLDGRAVTRTGTPTGRADRADPIIQAETEDLERQG